MVRTDANVRGRYPWFRSDISITQLESSHLAPKLVRHAELPPEELVEKTVWAQANQ